MRTYELAREFARVHRVVLAAGGREVPRRFAPGVECLKLPGIVRGPAGLHTLEASYTLEAAWRARSVLLSSALKALRPDVVVVEHYPFSKWDLKVEVEQLLEEARQIRANVRRICSVRDIVFQTSHEHCRPKDYEQRVLDSLHGGFDAVMAHGDPDMFPFALSFPAAPRIMLPVESTGIVCERVFPDPLLEGEIRRSVGEGPLIVASVGGGGDRTRLLPRCMAAWQVLRSSGEAEGGRLVLFAGLDCPPGEWVQLATQARSVGAELRPFGIDFLQWMAAANVSVSCAGYNTCANVLHTRVGAVLVPDPRMSDQALRAQRLAAWGLAEAVSSDPNDVAGLAVALLRALRLPRPGHTAQLDGAARARAFVERLAKQRAL